MAKQPIYEWDEESGLATCCIWLDDFLQGYGVAQCADRDKDMKSERTGLYIAELRAQINILQNYKNRELRPQLKILKHLKGTMQISTRYNPDSYEAKRLNKEIKNIEKDINFIQDKIDIIKQQLKDYMSAKEKLFKRIREKDFEGYKDEDSEMLLKDIEVYEKYGDKS